MRKIGVLIIFLMVFDFVQVFDFEGIHAMSPDPFIEDFDDYHIDGVDGFSVRFSKHYQLANGVFSYYNWGDGCSYIEYSSGTYTNMASAEGVFHVIVHLPTTGTGHLFELSTPETFAGFGVHCVSRTEFKPVCRYFNKTTGVYEEYEFDHKYKEGWHRFTIYHDYDSNTSYWYVDRNLIYVNSNITSSPGQTRAAISYHACYISHWGIIAITELSFSEKYNLAGKDFSSITVESDKEYYSFSDDYAYLTVNATDENGPVTGITIEETITCEGTGECYCDYWVDNGDGTYSSSPISIPWEGKYNVNVTVSKKGYNDGQASTTFEKGLLTGFWPNPDGYKFPNEKCDGVSWDIFKKTFNCSEVEYSIFGKTIKKPVPWIFYKTAYKNILMKGYLCFGMASSSLAYFVGDIEPAKPDLGKTTYELGRGDPHVWDNIKIYHGRQFSYLCWPLFIEEAILTPNMIYIFIEDYIESGEPIILSFIKPKLSLDLLSGHTVVAYKIEEKSDKEKIVWVYDSNRPAAKPSIEKPYTDIDNCFVTFNLENNTFTYHGLNNYNSQKGYYPVVHDIDMCRCAMLPWGHFIGLFSPADLTITDQHGRIIGHKDGELVNEISTALILSEEEETYYLSPDLHPSVDIVGTGEGTYDLTIFDFEEDAKRLYWIDDATVNTATTDNLSFDEYTMNYTTNDPHKTYSVQIYHENNDTTREYNFLNTSLSAEETMTVQFSDDGNSVSYVNRGSDKTYDLELVMVNDTGEYAFNVSTITIHENETQTFSVSDWVFSDESIVTLLIDKESDGIIDDEMPVENNSSNVNTDRTPPEANIAFNTETQDIEVVGVDDFDKYVDVSYKEYTEKSKTYRTYELKDDADNMLSITMEYKKNKNTVDIEILELVYNGEITIPQENKFHIVCVREEELKNLVQHLRIDVEDINVKYHPKKDESTITINGVEEKREGMVLVIIKIESGDLKYVLE